MDGATWCSWVIVCECPNVHRCKISQRFGPLLLKQQVFSQNRLDMPENSKDVQHRKHFMVRNDEKTRRRINSTPDVTMRPLVYISVSLCLCLRVCVCVCMFSCVQVCLRVYWSFEGMFARLSLYV